MMRCRPGIAAHSEPSEDPGSAVHHFVLHRVRETQSLRRCRRAGLLQRMGAGKRIDLR
jgi:hypothetical protein